MCLGVNADPSLLMNGCVGGLEIGLLGWCMG